MSLNFLSHIKPAPKSAIRLRPLDNSESAPAGAVRFATYFETATALDPLGLFSEEERAKELAQEQALEGNLGIVSDIVSHRISSRTVLSIEPLLHQGHAPNGTARIIEIADDDPEEPGDVSQRPEVLSDFNSLI